jgi:hypothetical protein
MVTNRLRFQNIDQSFSVGTQTAITGATVIKASKGLAYPQLVNKGDTQTLLNLYGAPSSQYPGVQEALDFINNYSLWLSAPGGTIPASNSYSYFGGGYLTTLGSFEPFYQVTESNTGIPSVNFLTAVQVGDGSPLSGNAAIVYSSYQITITGIPQAFFQLANVSGLVLSFTRSDGTTASITFTVNAAATTISCVNPNGGATLTSVAGAVSSSGTQITINGANSGPFTTYLNGSYSDLNFQTGSTVITSIATNNIVVQWIYNLQSLAIMSLYQNSPRAISGTVSNAKVDLQNPVYPQTTYTFTLGGSGSITSASTYYFTICGIVVSAVAGSTLTTPTQVVASMSSNITSGGYVLPIGYNATFGTTTVSITAARNLAAPTLTLGTNTTGFTVNNVTIYTLSGSGSVTSGTITIGGYILNYSGSAVTTNTGLATAIATIASPAVTGATGNYAVTASTNTIIITYAQSLPIPTLVLGSTWLGFSAALTTSPVATLGTAQTNYNYNTIAFNYNELSYPGNTYTNNYVLSPLSTQTDGAGNSQYAPTVLTGDNFLGAICYQSFTNMVPGFQFPNSFSFSMIGTRAATTSTITPLQLSSILVSGWNMLSIPALQNTNIFFDPECDSYNIPTTMASLRTSTYPFATFITGIKVSDLAATSTSAVNTIVNDIITARASYPNLTGLAYYCNEFWMSESYNSTSYYNIPLGAVASMLALIMDVKLGGAAPMFTNEGSPAVGGQINKSVQWAKYTLQASHLDSLDAAGINPIILDSYYNLMITSEKTAQSPIILTDWSYLGHQMSFDLFEAQIRQNVMLPQIGKLIDSYHMQLRTDQSNIYLSQRLSGPTAIWNSGQVFITQVNTPSTMAQNNFMMKIRVKVTPFSEYVTLIFNNVGQTSNVTSA